MADKKISALTAASTPLAGTEVLPIVQSSTTKQVSVANLTAGRAVSASSLALTTALPTTSGGTGLSSFTAAQVLFASSTSAIGQSANLSWNGTGLGLGVSAATMLLDVRGGATASVASFSSTDTTAYSATAYNGAKARMFFSGVGATGATLGMAFTSGGNNENYFGIVQEAGGSGAYVFQSYNGVAYGERFRIASNGDATVNNGNLIIGTSGKGIDFSATTEGSGTMTSELLSDYEEGTWTPVPTGVVVNDGTPVWSGKYTKVGRTVVATWLLSGGANVNFLTSSFISLPFTSSEIAWGSYGTNATNVFIGGMSTFNASLYFGTAAAGIGSAGGTIIFQV